MENNSLTVGQEIRRERHRLEMGLRRFCQIVDVSPALLSEIEMGFTAAIELTDDELMRIGDALGLVAHWLYDDALREAALNGGQGVRLAKREPACLVPAFPFCRHAHHDEGAH